jgi:hypothetical protein
MGIPSKRGELATKLSKKILLVEEKDSNLAMIVGVEAFVCKLSLSCVDRHSA